MPERKHYKLTNGTKTIIVLIICIICLKFSNKIQTNKIKNAFEILNSNDNTTKYKCKVTKVMDGDTIEVTFLESIPENCNKTENVRLIGVDTPELNLHNSNPKEYFAQEAYQFTYGELINEYIEISFDNISSQRDKYNRLLCYVYYNDYLFNEVLIQEGFGRYYYFFDFNKKYMNDFKKSEIFAKENKLGLWEQSND